MLASRAEGRSEEHVAPSHPPELEPEPWPGESGGSVPPSQRSASILWKACTWTGTEKLSLQSPWWHTCHPRSQEAEAGGLWVWCYVRLRRETLSQNIKPNPHVKSRRNKRLRKPSWIRMFEFPWKCPAPVAGLASLVQHRCCTSPGHFHSWASKPHPSWGLSSPITSSRFRKQLLLPGKPGMKRTGNTHIPRETLLRRTNAVIPPMMPHACDG